MRLILTTIILTMLAQTSAAQTVISCTGIQGKAFYSQEGKWVDDGGTKIRLDLILNNDQFDISIGDLAGPTTIKSMGGQVYLLGNSDNKATILATYGNGHSELYTYDFNAKKVYLSQHRTAGSFQKFSTYEGDCSSLNFNPFF